jgi:biopolymer transport protein ExbD/biopolymer transport protein TolR
MAAGFANAPLTRHRGRRRRAVMSEINVTPFVDVMLVLLIVFMVTAPLMTLSIRVDLPNTRGGTLLHSEKAPLSVTLKKSGGTCSTQADIFLDKSPIALADIGTKFAAIKKSTPPGKKPPMVWVNADRDLCYNEVARVLGTLHDAGFGTALNVTDQKEGAKPQARAKAGE